MSVEDLHPARRQAAVAWLYEPDDTMREVGEEFDRSQAWVSQAVDQYRREVGP